MHYNKCPKCDLNYKLVENELCEVCKKELAGEYDCEDLDMLCPICYKNKIDYDEVICTKCAKHRRQNGDFDI